jgi:hypothetical protein
MDEQRWLACEDPHQMLEFLRGRASDRQLRLFDCACCRRLWHLLTRDEVRAAVEVAERFSSAASSRRQPPVPSSWP